MLKAQFALVYRPVQQWELVPCKREQLLALELCKPEVMGVVLVYRPELLESHRRGQLELCKLELMVCYIRDIWLHLHISHQRRNRFYRLCN
jgi:hypothetical protein